MTSARTIWQFREGHQACYCICQDGWWWGRLYPRKFL